MNSRNLASVVVFTLLCACANKALPLGGDPGLQVLDLTALPAPENSDGLPGGRDFRIGPFDKIVIDVFGVDDLSREAQVDGNGAITFPLVGGVQAGGLTPDQLSQAIADGLRGKYVRDPQVTVNFKEAVSQVVSVDGEVRKPGSYPVMGSMSLMRSIANAGGTSEFARLDDVVVFREVGGQRYVALYNLQAIRRGMYADPEIYPNDIVVVGDSPSRRMFVDLLGASSLLATPLVALANKL